MIPSPLLFRELLDGIEDAARNPAYFPNIPNYFVDLEAELLSLSTDSLGRISETTALKLGTNAYRTVSALNHLVTTGTILHFEGTREQPESACYLTRPILLADLFKLILSIGGNFCRKGLLRKADLFEHAWRARTDDKEGFPTLSHFEVCWTFSSSMSLSSELANPTFFLCPACYRWNSLDSLLSSGPTTPRVRLDESSTSHSFRKAFSLAFSFVRIT